MEIGKMGSFLGGKGFQVWVNFSYRPYVCFNFDDSGLQRVRLFATDAWDIFDERWRE